MLLQYTGSKSLYTNAHKIGKIPHIVKYNFSCTLYRSSSCRMTFLDDCLCGSRCIIVTSNHEPSTDHTLLSPASWVMYAKSIHIGYILTLGNVGNEKNNLQYPNWLCYLNQVQETFLTRHSSTGEEHFNDFDIDALDWSYAVTQNSFTKICFSFEVVFLFLLVFRNLLIFNRTVIKFGYLKHSPKHCFKAKN